jgi:hypothetical protein
MGGGEDETTEPADQERSALGAARGALPAGQLGGMPVGGACGQPAHGQPTNRRRAGLGASRPAARQKPAIGATAGPRGVPAESAGLQEPSIDAARGPGGIRAGRHPGAGGRRRALMRHEGREASGPAGPGGPGYRRPGTRGAAAGYRRVQSRWRRGIAHSRLLRAVPASTRGVFLAGDCATPLDRLISGASEVAKLGCAVHAASRWGKRRGEE